MTYQRPMRVIREQVGEPPAACRTWDEVAEIWYRRSGERLTRQGIKHVAAVAMRKLRRVIERDPVLSAEVGLDAVEDDDEEDGEGDGRDGRQHRRTA